MKYLLACAAALVIVSACNNNTQSTTDTSEDKTGRLTRNTAINASNAYSDIFLPPESIEKFITQQKLPQDIADGFRDFYNVRNFQAAWFNSEGLTEQALAFRSLYDYDDSSNAPKALDRQLDELMSEDSMKVSATDENITRTELLLSWRFMNYINKKYDGAELKQEALKEMVPIKKESTLAAAQTMLDDKDFSRLIRNDWYPALRKQLEVYVGLSKKGGWPAIPAAASKIKKTSNDSLVLALKRRLQVTGDLTTADTSRSYTNELDAAVKTMQSRYGLKADGIITKYFIEKLNVPVDARIQQLLANMERIRWMPAISSGRAIMVNIPEYILHAKNGKDSAFNMNIVVGKEGHSTVMFSGELNQVVFSPCWNLPPSIVKKEVLPDIEKNPDYLRENDMEVTGEENGLPVIRQIPGDKNELGKVKFLFPNSFNIYFHDTPHKALFSQAKRSYSHGCIRLAEPAKLARWVLAEQGEWTDEKIDSAMNAKEEKFVKVKDPIPVLICYYTAWVDENGKMQWRDDIYGHDKKMSTRLFN